MRLAALVLVPALVLAGCSSGAEDDGRSEVAAAAYPLAWLASQVAGADAEVLDLVDPGVEPHDVELTPRQVADLREADLVVHLKGFQPAVDDALDDTPALDLALLQDKGSEDPHIWLDPLRMRAAAIAMTDRLVEVDPDHADGYRTRGKALVAQLAQLDATFRSSLQRCARKEVVTSHAAFGYLAARYGLVQRGISGLSPDAEPSPADLADVVRFAREHRVTTIFFETLVDPAVARTVADEVGARTAVLDPVESVRDGDDYLSVMRRNAAALHDALGCA